MIREPFGGQFGTDEVGDAPVNARGGAWFACSNRDQTASRTACFALSMSTRPPQDDILIDYEIVC
ncbi:hypothetical protein Vqi01_05380 [Micromonospora qiuiae]|uniref:Uncharacterized protein n=1 Tax=Micromonospora qiuiae TaxID=502268 RepID=A0ABQ4J5E1_9ACTN|nr:hypothetical protein Vqi01_05380 [Micromonospora qiuiae]